jgi:hypothetical protein
MVQWKYKQLRACLLYWHRVTLKQLHLRSIVKRVLSRMINKSLSFAYHQWLSEIRIQNRRTIILQRVRSGSK